MNATQQVCNVCGAVYDPADSDSSSATNPLCPECALPLYNAMVGLADHIHTAFIRRCGTLAMEAMEAKMSDERFGRYVAQMTKQFNQLRSSLYDV